jgi:peptidoglycan/LPS O-acetylase OafA/YrhL
VRPARDSALDGVRAIAALSVLVFHVWTYRDWRPHGELHQLLDQVLWQANGGLIAFFVLSGFLLYRGFARAAVTGSQAPGLGRYALRRGARILPAYWVCCIGCVALYLAFGPTNILPGSSKLPLFAVFAENYSLDTLMQLNPVFWTLGIEVTFYLALPLLALAARRLGRIHLGAHVAFLVALIGVTVLWHWLAYANHWGQIPMKILPFWLGHFAVGMLIALWLEQRRARGRVRIGAPATAALMVAGWALVLLQGVWRYSVPTGTAERALFATLLTATGFALIVAAAAGGRGPAMGWLRARPLVSVGVVSYGLYLWHLPLLLVLREAGALPHDLVPRTLVVLAAALAAATLSWRLVERPALAWAERTRSPAPRPVLQPA